MLSITLLTTLLLVDPAYDLLLKGGRLIDPKSGIASRQDLAIHNGKVAAIGPDLDVTKAKKVVDVTGLVVTPGLIDLHAHVYAGTGQRGAYCGDNSVYPDGFTFRAGCTTIVDAGSAGFANVDDFKDRVIDRSKTRVLAFLNIVGHGMCGAGEQDVSDMQPEPTAKAVLAHRDFVVGIKTAHFDAPEWTAVDRAIAAGELAHVPVMVDFGTFRKERPYEILVTQKLRPGDISTHCYAPSVPLLDARGRVREFEMKARQRGVLFDVGHGAGSFLFRQAVPAIQDGFLPDTISTDLHIASMNGGMQDLTSVLSKFLNMGMSLDAVVARATWNAARVLHHEELGNLAVGGIADVAVLRVVDGPCGFVDVYGARMRGDRRIECELTLKGGAVEWDKNGLTREDWAKLGNYGQQ